MFARVIQKSFSHAILIYPARAGTLTKVLLLYYIILNLPQFTNDLQIHLKYMY